MHHAKTAAAVSERSEGVRGGWCIGGGGLEGGEEGGGREEGGEGGEGWEWDWERREIVGLGGVWLLRLRGRGEDVVVEFER